ncbi:hypothetical protein [Candidatus Soleaferrea massiliensis]|uniref:hypothetical protein n=1 Tax=Candidatus Soleaferrea massiliensis TaxID=1470354 RepID=UPI0012E039C7|nr:hypothetical protein [Candidatus Soleaferrea massiliensis]
MKVFTVVFALLPKSWPKVYIFPIMSNHSAVHPFTLYKNKGLGKRRNKTGRLVSGSNLS